MSRRERYVVDDDDAAGVCAAVFDILATVVTQARIDAYSDFHEQMPADIRAAQAWLRERSSAQATAVRGEVVTVASTDAIGWAIVRAFAPWSTRTALHDATDVNRATIEDGGHAVTVDLLTREVAALRDLLSREATIGRVVDG